MHKLNLPATLSRMNENITKRWQFWIDVGGTFTDCVACNPDGELKKFKTLSSGVVKGRIDSIQGTRVRDELRANDPERFSRGWNFSCRSEDGTSVWESRVIDFDQSSYELILEDRLPPEITPGMQYELTAEIEAPIICIRALLGLTLQESIPAIDLRLGTTRGTNALLERKGAKTAFLVTKGFADLLLIGNQDRPDLFALDIQKPLPLYAEVVEVAERMDANGTILSDLDEDLLRQQLSVLRENGIKSIAIALLNSYRNPIHEKQVERLAREVGFEEVSRSSQVSPTIKIVPRAETTVIDAYLTPVLRDYVARIRSDLNPGSTFKLMTSHGGLIDASLFSGKDSLLSGPAGGVVAYSRIAEEAGFDQSIGFDMGGTSTDVSRFGGEFERQSESVIAGLKIASPTLAIETVAAGGGSICSFDGIQLSVGPESAGADPGPACYGRGGPLTVTDMNVALGRVLPREFPFPLDLKSVHEKLTAMCDVIKTSLGHDYSPNELAQGFIDIANETMSRAIRKVSIQKGFHPSDHLLVTFGGAGGLHACAIAKTLGMNSILVHPFAGILSAYGMGLADVRKRDERTVLETLSTETLTQAETIFTELEESLRQKVSIEGISNEQIQPARRSLNLRYQGIESTIEVREPDDGDYRQAYESQHEQFFGYRRDDRAIEVVSAVVEIVGKTDQPKAMLENSSQSTEENFQTVEVWERNQSLQVPVFRREQLPAKFTAPAIVCDSGATLWVDADFQGRVTEDGSILLERLHKEMTSSQKTQRTTNPDPIRLEVFNNQFASIAEQMGVTLQKTSISTNVKERLDYSCAIFDATGNLVVNAPHIPVHLGAMGETVQTVLQDFPDLAPGDVIVTNDPFGGGSHLPDITVVTPVHNEAGTLLFLTASRAHHAEIGGITPGSMPPFSRNLSEEGVLIRSFKLIDRGESREDELKILLTSGPFPSRNPDDNLADIAAQVAANQTGAKLLSSMIKQSGQDVVLTYMKHIQNTATKKMKRALSRLSASEYSFIDHLDDGSPIAVAVRLSEERVTIDFSGTGPVLKTNLNANRAIVTAACLYVFRCLIDEAIPLNQGVLEPVEIVLPECLLNPPRHDDPQHCAAMVGGNVETSQRVVDVLLGALRQAAASQGTMNNLTFGDDTFGYYETICGGAGATPNVNGASAVHTHMTNTRLTDVEVIEHRYPVRVLQFKIRQESGGEGTYSGGDGIVRSFEFLRPLKVSLLTQRRREFPPFGLEGGKPGKVGVNSIRRSSSSEFEMLGPTAHLNVNRGDQLTIETPGGGGFGTPKS